MSIRAMSQVWDHFPRGGSDMLVVLALADWCNDLGESLHPSIGAIATKCRLSEWQARRIVHQLIDNGFLEVIGNEFGGAPGTTRQYRLRLDRISAETPGVDATPTASACDSPTASADATPGADARAGAGARDGWRPCSETASTHASQTIIEPSVTTKRTRTSKKASNEVKAKTSLPEDFAISEGVRKWAHSNGHQNLEAHFEYFVDTVRANGNRYIDWDAAFKKAVRSDWAGLSRRQFGRSGDANARFAN